MVTQLNRDHVRNTPRPAGTPLERGFHAEVNLRLDPLLRGVARSDGVCEESHVAGAVFVQ